MPEEATTTPAADSVNPPVPQATEPGKAETPAAQNVGELPDWAQKLITDVRGEAAKYRTEAKTAAEQAQAELTDRFAKVFGLKDDDATNPEALAKAATEAQAAAAKSARELAIFKAAATTGADPSRLLDSNAFMTSVAGLEPGDGAGITSAIQAAIAANPTLKAVQATAASGTELGGSGETGQITEEQLQKLVRTNPEEVVRLRKAGKLDHFLS